MRPFFFLLYLVCPTRCLSLAVFILVGFVYGTFSMVLARFTCVCMYQETRQRLTWTSGGWGTEGQSPGNPASSMCVRSNSLEPGSSFSLLLILLLPVVVVFSKSPGGSSNSNEDEARRHVISFSRGWAKPPQRAAAMVHRKSKEREAAVSFSVSWSRGNRKGVFDSILVYRYMCEFCF